MKSLLSLLLVLAGLFIAHQQMEIYSLEQQIASCHNENDRLKGGMEAVNHEIIFLMREYRNEKIYTGLDSLLKNMPQGATSH